MWGSSYTAADGHHEPIGPGEREREPYIHLTESTAATPPQDYQTSRSEQSPVPGDPGVNTFARAAFFYSQDIPKEGVSEPSIPNNIIHSPPPDLHLAQYPPHGHAHLPYNTLVENPAYDETEDNYPIHQPVMPFQPVPHTVFTTPTYEDSGWPRHTLSQLSTPGDQCYVEGQSSGTTPEGNHDPYEKQARISDSDGVLRSHSAAVESPLPFAGQPTPIVPYNPDTWTHTGASVSHPAGRVGSDVMYSPQVGPLAHATGESASQKIASTLAARHPTSYDTADGYHEVANPVEREREMYTRSIETTTFIPRRVHHAGQSEQSFVSPRVYSSSSQGPGGCQDIPTEEVLETSISTNIIHSPPSGSHLAQYPPHDQARFSYSTLTGGPAYDETGDDYSIHQPVMLFQPVLHTDIITPTYENNDWSRHTLSQPSPPGNQYYVEGQSPGATPEGNHDPYEEQARISDSDGALRPHSAAVQSPLPFTGQPTSIVACKSDASRQLDASVSHPADGVGSTVVSELPVGPPLVENVGTKTRKKRERGTTPDEMGDVNTIRRKRPRRPANPQGLTRMPHPHFLFTRPDLRIVEQNLYRCETSQKAWTPHPSIDFNVKGVEGMKLTDAMNLRFDGPDGRDDPMFTGESNGNSVSCRINFVECPPCTRPRQIMKTDHRKDRHPIKKEKLAYEVAKCIKARLTELKEPFRVPFENMFLTRLVNVSLSSWQPEIWYQDSPSTSS